MIGILLVTKYASTGAIRAAETSALLTKLDEDVEDYDHNETRHNDESQDHAEEK